MSLSGCSHFSGRASSWPPIPSVAELSCCWQSEEKIDLRDKNGDYTFHSVVAVAENQLTVVVLDGLGYRHLTLVYDGTGALRTLAAPPSWDGEYSHYFLLAIYLHHLKPGAWPVNQPHWRVKWEGSKKSLYYKNDEIMTLNYTDSQDPLAQTRNVVFADLPLILTVTTLTRMPL
ncbi:MAG: DUF3261 domain-containing protein [Gammaproteobacteria bacterium]|nr:DUF3261 domain-containing protein [Gammaproteobacteria bacterium]